MTFRPINFTALTAAGVDVTGLDTVAGEKVLAVLESGATCATTATGKLLVEASEKNHSAKFEGTVASGGKLRQREAMTAVQLTAYILVP